MRILLVCLLVHVGAALSSADSDSMGSSDCLSAALSASARTDGENLMACTRESLVPSRSFAYPSNLILGEEAVNEIGQRTLDNTVTVSFTLHPNGDGLGDGIRLKSDSFGHIDDVISTYCCELMKMSEERCAVSSGARLVTETGVRLLSFNDVEEGQRVYCVPQAVHFVWPLKKTGYTFYPKNVVGPVPDKPIRMKQLSESPRVFSVDNFVSPQEVEELLSVNQNKLSPSEVGFGGWQDDTRTSSTAWDDATEASHNIRVRTFQILGMEFDPDMADALQVLQYTADGYRGQGQWYKPHVDWFDESSYDGHDPLVNNGSNRFATMFLYLSTVEEGGATVFPLSTTHEGYGGEKLVHDGTIDTPGYISTVDARRCCNESLTTALRTKPVSGNAVLFYSQGPDGKLDPFSLHGGCPPLKGTKWSANVWIWNRRSPPKSSAKDAPPTTVDGQMSITLLNMVDSKIGVYWDSAVPEESMATFSILEEAY
jgi:prolyl 4-hydroxylase